MLRPGVKPTSIAQCLWPSAVILVQYHCAWSTRHWLQLLHGKPTVAVDRNFAQCWANSLSKHCAWVGKGVAWLGLPASSSFDLQFFRECTSACMRLKFKGCQIDHLAGIETHVQIQCPRLCKYIFFKTVSLFVMLPPTNQQLLIQKYHRGTTFSSANKTFAAMMPSSPAATQAEPLSPSP